jgi:hypothetical protein
MAKLAVINREAKRRATVKKFAEKRKQLLAIIQDPKATDDARDEARSKLQALPRNASPVRLRNRCAMTGPPARHVPQVRPRAQQDPRDRHARRDPRNDQGQLVRKTP